MKNAIRYRVTYSTDEVEIDVKECLTLEGAMAFLEGFQLGKRCEKECNISCKAITTEDKEYNIYSQHEDSIKNLPPKGE